jgi:peptidoglycan/LPS O-acetylase OafA/YrhL
VGNRSYAIYLCHIPIFFLLREACFRFGFLHVPAWLLGLTAACLIALVAAANFRYVEQPLRRHGRQVATQFMASRRKTASSSFEETPQSSAHENQAAISA